MLDFVSVDDDEARDLEPACGNEDFAQSFLCGMTQGSGLTMRQQRIRYDTLVDLFPTAGPDRGDGVEIFQLGGAYIQG